MASRLKSWISLRTRRTTITSFLRPARWFPIYLVFLVCLYSDVNTCTRVCCVCEVDLPILSWVGGRVVVQPKRRKPQAIQPRRRKPQAKLDLNKRQRVLSTNATSINSSISLIAPDLSRGEDSSVSECNVERAVQSLQRLASKNVRPQSPPPFCYMHSCRLSSYQRRENVWLAFFAKSCTTPLLCSKLSIASGRNRRQPQFSRWMGTHLD